VYHESALSFNSLGSRQILLAAIMQSPPILNRLKPPDREELPHS
jgi:hypothetical protein